MKKLKKFVLLDAIGIKLVGYNNKKMNKKVVLHYAIEIKVANKNARQFL